MISKSLLMAKRELSYYFYKITNQRKKPETQLYSGVFILLILVIWGSSKELKLNSSSSSEGSIQDKLWVKPLCNPLNYRMVLIKIVVWDLCRVGYFWREGVMPRYDVRGFLWDRWSYGCQRWHQDYQLILSIITGNCLQFWLDPSKPFRNLLETNIRDQKLSENTKKHQSPKRGAVKISKAFYSGGGISCFK